MENNKNGEGHADGPAFLSHIKQATISAIAKPNFAMRKSSFSRKEEDALFEKLAGKDAVTARKESEEEEDGELTRVPSSLPKRAKSILVDITDEKEPILFNPISEKDG
jgi:hypothetical protein